VVDVLNYYGVKCGAEAHSGKATRSSLIAVIRALSFLLYISSQSPIPNRTEPKRYKQQTITRTSEVDIETQAIRN
jgi:hypothetical protein